MGSKNKIRARFVLNPASVSYKELLGILEDAGFAHISSKGSHVKFKHPKLSRDLIIPVHKNTCKDFYKKLAKDFLLEVAQDI